MGRLGVRHAVELLRDGQPPQREILTRVELIDSENIESFTQEEPVDTDPGKDS